MKNTLLFSWVTGLLLIMGFGTFLLSADRFYVERFMTAKQNQTPLFIKPAFKSSPKTYLKSGETVKYQYLSQSGQWVYVLFNEDVLAGKTEDLRVSIIEYKSKSYSVENIHIAMLLSFIFFIITLFNIKVKSNEIKKKELINANQLNDINQLRNNIKEKEALLTFFGSELIASKEHINDLASINERNQHLAEKVNSLELKTKEHESIKEKLTNKLKLELEKFYLQENSAKSSPLVEDLRASEERLTNQLHKQVEEAKVFGIDFHHDRYENILKGRQFEIFIALWLTKHLNFKIAEWSPDKGFEQGIFVKSNTNPDFIVISPDGKKLAIECKYRSSFNIKDTKEHAVSWSTMQQGYRYKEFQEENEYPVFICLGMYGTPEKPDNFAMLPIKELMKASAKKEFNNKQFIITKSKIDALNEKNSRLFTKELATEC